MPFDKEIDYIIIGDIRAEYSDCDSDSEPKEDAQWKRVTVKNGKKFARCDLYDGSAPPAADEMAETWWADAQEQLEDGDEPESDEYSYFGRKLPTMAINRLVSGELDGVIVGPSWVILPAAEYPFEDDE